jgi:hypothetical protein
MSKNSQNIKKKIVSQSAEQAKTDHSYSDV